MNKARIAAILAPLLFAACQAAPGEAPLAGAKMGGPFTLTSQTGAKVSDTQFAGQYRLIYFGYSYCPDVCPVDLQKLMQGLQKLEKQDAAKAAKIQPIFITIDPKRDTPDVLKQYVSAFHPRLIGLTGSEAEIAAVAKEYAIYYRKAEGGTADAYLVDHARQATLYGPTGDPIALIPQDGTPDDIAAELAKWVK
ncbi:protein SCO1/2 [Sphingomonas laterariae]|uniref:Protein SCO1/2 n=2 Tax=Edaphosphingomonas laterariae TaxID=861865 RepID=A0A239GRL8_9SPHN|nr:SCO family protein [Sphingomonas laterariae]SNS71472.1 protein SCO1/2 [Sphingomonas laterariae]